MEIESRGYQRSLRRRAPSKPFITQTPDPSALIWHVTVLQWADRGRQIKAHE